MPPRAVDRLRRRLWSIQYRAWHKRYLSEPFYIRCLWFHDECVIDDCDDGALFTE